MREYIDISYRLQKQWFDICKNYTVYHKPFSFIIPKLSGQEAHRLIDVSRVYKLGSSQLAMFGVYTIWGGDPTPYVKMDFNIANIPHNLSLIIDTSSTNIYSMPSSFNSFTFL